MATYDTLVASQVSLPATLCSICTYQTYSTSMIAPQFQRGCASTGRQLLLPWLWYQKGWVGQHQRSTNFMARRTIIERIYRNKGRRFYHSLRLQRQQQKFFIFWLARSSRALGLCGTIAFRTPVNNSLRPRLRGLP